ncbi:T5orf172 domain-containing protein [Arcicella aurantiaca]|uniref:T5orf172 domain-containing protein n=1 Tax=Arcicella aurantiaca TaxID=591202 RepID=A0A316EGW2_9BACT|nr:GIY-YIG nuclease family protein [Arcicella aurantiaca]PWK28948.1 T5orf172 domain-containing protein [Arcicella aurantiaca]
MDKNRILDEIFSNDPFEMLNIKPTSSGTRNDEERLFSSFQPIVDFYQKNNREPLPVSEDIQEYQLFSRLKSIRENPSKMEILKKYDTYGFLTTKNVEINSIDDIFNDDSFGLLENDNLGLFDFKHINAPDKDRAETDFVARRKPCKDFNKYEQRLRDVQNDLKIGKRKLVDFNQGNLREGAFYIHNGVLFLLEKINISFKEHYREDGTRVREDGRTRCIFENGTESNMLKRSVEKILYANGKVVTENADEVAESFVNKVNNITEQDQAFGYIYVLKSKSSNQEIKQINNLYKIGYSKITVEERIKNAKEEPTYLMADVSILQTYKCYNINPQKLEQLLHIFFGKACLDIDIFDKNGNRHTPREWFIAPLHIIESAIEMIISGEILKYKYDIKNQEIIES